MAGAGTTLETLRLNRRETGRLSLAVALSLAVHLFAWGGYEAGKKFNVWQLLPRIVWLVPAPKTPPAQNPEPPLEFVMVEQPSAAPPQNAKYYSSRNSRAANPNPADLTVPKIVGKQAEVPKTETVLKPDFNRLQPAPQPMSRPQTPSPAVTPGDLTLANPRNSQPEQTERPRTLAQALHQLPGQMMKQDGGVPRQATTPAFDVKLTGYGDYDERFIEAVSQRWFDLLDSRQFALDRAGKVVLQFTLHFDGRVTDMKITENTVGDVLGYVCEKAINDPAPFAPWSSDMRQKLGDSRDFQFTFYY